MSALGHYQPLSILAAQRLVTAKSSRSKVYQPDVRFRPQAAILLVI